MAKVVRAEPTPNPNALKFVLDRPLTDRTMSFLTPAAGVGHPLAEQLFAVSGVVGLLFVADFVTVNKAAEAKWSTVRAKVKRILESA